MQPATVVDVDCVRAANQAVDLAFAAVIAVRAAATASHVGAGDSGILAGSGPYFGSEPCPASASAVVSCSSVPAVGFETVAGFYLPVLTGCRLYLSAFDGTLAHKLSLQVLAQLLLYSIIEKDIALTWSGLSSNFFCSKVIATLMDCWISISGLIKRSDETLYSIL